MTKTFREDIISGLQQDLKSLPSKYFYDENGDKLFQEIMNMEEYYLPVCETEIINNKSAELAALIAEETAAVDIIELGAGDGSKTKEMLREFQSTSMDCTYIPMDISEHILTINEKIISEECPKLKIIPIAGDYFETMKQIKERKNLKLVLFMGGNIGNYTHDRAVEFLKKVKGNLTKNDQLLIAFDLKKHPKKILAAYNDSQGITKKFNLNLLRRINKELSGDFDLDAFDHYATYDPISGRTKSYLISLKDQTVSVSKEVFKFDKHEAIHMELSKKYSLSDIEKLAHDSGLKLIRHFMDDDKEYTLSLLQPTS